MTQQQNDYSNIHIESSMPKPWEREATFNDVLYDWMGRAPWLAISAAAHVVIVLIMMAIPWEQMGTKQEKKIEASLDQAPEEVFEDPPPEEPEEIEEEEPTEEPVLKDAEVSDHNEDDTNQDFESVQGDPDFTSDSPFDSKAFNDAIGIGGGAGGKFGGRFGGRKNLKARGGSGTEQALKDGLEWLRWHQSEDGSWDSDGFMTNCGHIAAGQTCKDPGEAQHDVGMTGLALLAFLGDGNTTREGPYKEQVAKGINWLKTQQDPDLGLIGEQVGHAFIYNHAIAALSVCEAYYFSKSPLIKRTAQDAIKFIGQARNPYGAWRYNYPPTGESDTSVTGWCVFALKSAEEAGLTIDHAAFKDAESFIIEMTDPATGRCGYDSVGSQSSRITRVNDHFPPENGEAMSAVALLCRFFLGQDPEKEPMMAKHADLLAKKLPKWDPDSKTIDFYYWYYGSYAMYQMGGTKYWDVWNKAMKTAVVESQRKEGDEKGSWDATVDPWGYAGGRVYTTALGVLCLEVYFRYAKVLGAR
ncbi:MAG: terpene cyclase/mutase family protein [Planctomycetes bacterium]|nr:terpene cyclase/mutase family protein [Planctomycetota bacterium]